MTWDLSIRLLQAPSNLTPWMFSGMGQPVPVFHRTLNLIWTDIPQFKTITPNPLATSPPKSSPPLFLQAFPSTERYWKKTPAVKFCFCIYYRRQTRLCCFFISINILFWCSHLIIFKGVWITATVLCYFESALSASSSFFLSLVELFQEPQDPHLLAEVLPVHLQPLLVEFWFAVGFF